MNTELKIVKEEKYGFFNKIFYSIAKPSKYGDMAMLGLKKACSYLILLIAIIAIILSVLATYNVKKIISVGTDYINNNISDFSFKNYELLSNEEIILTNHEITDFFAYSIIINTNLSIEEAKEKYKDIDSGYNIVILLKNNFLIMNKDSKAFLEYSYEDSMKNYGIENDKEYKKEDVVSYFNNTSPASYIFQYFSLYFITYFIVFMIDVIVVVLLGFIIKSVLKKKMSKHELGEYAIYSITPSVLIFLIYLTVNFFTNFAISYFEFIILAISIIYMFLAINNRKNDKFDLNSENKENKTSETVVNETILENQKELPNSNEKEHK